jgi:uncharacterized protein (DUF1499 family)
MTKFFKRALLVLLIAIAIGCTLSAIEYFGGQPMGLFSGARPTDLGFSAGKFKPVSWKPNAVSSTADAKDEKHYIAPFTYSGDRADAWKRLTTIVKAQPRANIVSEKADYLHAEFKTAGMGFVDDVEFALDARANTIHVRSASRLGVRDFGVNRERVETLRALFAK